MNDEPNGMTRYLILAVCVVAVVGLLALTLILCIEDHPEHAIVYAGLLTTFLATILTGIYTIAGIKKLTVQTNSRMTELLDATRTVATAAGRIAGVAQEKAAEQSRKDAANV